MDIPNYVLIRKDVEGTVPKHGVCLYISSKLMHKEITVDIPNVVVVYLLHLNLYVLSIYRPPSYSENENAVLLDFLYNFCTGKELIIMGDFNLPTIKWGNDLAYDGISNSDLRFYHCFLSLGLNQWVHESTYYISGNILDLVFSSEEDRVGDVKVCPPFPNCAHCPVLFDYIIQDHSQSQEPIVQRLWHKGNYNQIRSYLAGIDWDYEFMHLEVDEKFVRLLDLIRPLINRFVPIKSYDNSIHPAWPVKCPHSIVRRRKDLWCQYKVVRSTHGRNSVEANELLQEYLFINHTYRNFSIFKQYEYEASLTQSLTQNPKVFHSYIRRKKVGKPSIGPLRTADGEMVYDPKAMSELFATTFSSVYSASVPESPAPHQTFHGHIEELDITIDLVHDVLSKLDSSSSMGPDELHPHFLKSCRLELAYPLTQIFCSSYNAGVLPAIWKKSYIIPIFKKGSRYDPLLYRPVSLTSVCAKSMEKIVVKFLFDYLDSNNLLNANQFGFRPGHSTEDQLVLTYNDVTMWLDQGFNVDLVLFDFSKAFDVVCHTVLIEKFSKLGITGKLLDWIREFLIGREMNVVVDHKISNPRAVRSGVPQGSVLGPLLFLIYVNFLTHSVLAQTKIFADDLKLYIKIKTDSGPSILSDMLMCQQAIDSLFNVSKSWGLKMNSSKCVVLRFQRRQVDWEALGITGLYYMDSTPIPVRDTAVDLGITLDSSLKFHQHIANIVNKAGGVMQNILKATINRDATFMVPLFTTHVRPLLEYSSALWNLGYIGDIKLLESVQRRWTKNIRGLENLSYSERLKLLNLFSIQGRLLRHDIVKYWQIFHNRCAISPTDLFDSPLNPSTRGHQYKIAHVRTQLDLRKRFFSVRGIHVWNSLPDSLVSLQCPSSFKTALAKFLGEKLFEYA